LNLNERLTRHLKEAKQAEIYQLKITLKYVRPSVWRRVQVASGITLAKLHRIIQEVMGWYDSHLHQFIAAGKYYGVPSSDDPFDFDLKNERKTRLRKILSKPKKKIVYEYDFGDGWEHEMALEKILQSEPGVRYPRCIGGARACPPEDCGGTGGTRTFCRRSVILNIKSTTSISIGSAANSIPKSSIWNL
jgi:Plasmid pRiA4b ORF-3-like protein